LETWAPLWRRAGWGMRKPAHPTALNLFELTKVPFDLLGNGPNPVSRRNTKRGAPP